MNTVVRVPKLAELIASAIRAEVIRGDLASGDRLPSEPVLMARFRASRPSVREALRILEFEQLVTIHRGVHGGAKVNTPSPEVAGQRLRTTLAVWGTDAVEASALVAGAEIAAIRKIAGSIAQGSAPPLLSAAGEGVSFHVQLVEQSDLAMANALVGALGDRSTSSTCEGSAAHRTVVRLIRQGDADQAVDRWREHQDELCERLDLTFGVRPA